MSYGEDEGGIVTVFAQLLIMLRRYLLVLV